jgi:hypothetical protein
MKITVKNILLLFSCIFIQTLIKAQENKRFTVKPGESVDDVLTADQIFRYAEFFQGKVLFFDGTYIEALLNYNRLLGEMEFITNKGDTMSIGNTGDIDVIILPQDSFYFHGGYLERIAGDGNIMLLVNNYTRLVNVKKQGAYGLTSSSGDINSYSYFNSAKFGRRTDLKVQEEMIFSFETDYFFMDKDSKYAPAKKNTLLKLLPAYREEINEYLKKENIDFKKPDSLTALTKYLTELTEGLK